MSSIDQSVQPAGTRKSQLWNRRDIAFRFAPRYRVVWFSLAGMFLLALITASAEFRTDAMSLVTGLAGVLAIAAAGQLLVIMAGGIDLSVPAVMTFAAAIIVHQSQGHNGRLAGAILEVVALSAAVGLVNGLLVAFARLNAMIVTLAMAGSLTGVMLIWIGTTFSTTGNVPPTLSKMAARHVGFLSLVGIVAIVLVVLLAALLRSTSIGRGYVAAGTNRTAATIIGVRVAWYELGGYVLAAILYGAAGIFLAGLLTTPDFTMGDAYQLTTIIAVALGGASLAGGPASVLGTMGGCLFVAMLQEYLALKSFAAGVDQVVNGLVLVLAVALVTVGAGGRLRLRSLLPVFRR